MLKGTGQFSEHVATWDTRRRWVARGVRRARAAGYSIGSAYTAVKDPARTRFLYRDRLWQGADLVGLGVASFGHVNGVHVQNARYLGNVRRRDRPRRAAARPRLSSDRRRAADPRGDSPAQARLDSAGLLRREVRRGCRASASREAWKSRSPRLPRAAASPGHEGDRVALDRARACCASTRCSSASSCRSTGESGTRDTGIAISNPKSKSEGLVQRRLRCHRDRRRPGGLDRRRAARRAGPPRAAARARDVAAVSHRRVADSVHVVHAESPRRRDWLRESACPKKYSVQFVSITGKVSQPFYFFQTIEHECSQTWQVWRARVRRDAARQRAQEGRRSAAGRHRARRPDGRLPRRRRARRRQGRRQGRGDPRQGRGRRHRPRFAALAQVSPGRTTIPT